MSMKLLKLPESGIQNIPAGLRKLADKIENGEFAEAHNLAWIIDCGDSQIEYGLLGKSAEPGAVFNLLLSIVQHRFIGEI